MKKSNLFLSCGLILTLAVAGCSAYSTAKVATTEKAAKTSTKTALTKQEDNKGFPGKMTLSTTKGEVGTSVHFSISGLKANTETKLEWKTVKGKYDLSGLYTFTGVSFKDKIVPMTNGTSKQMANSKAILPFRAGLAEIIPYM